MTRIHQVRIYPNQKQIVRLDSTLWVACGLVNAAIEERRKAYVFWKRYGHVSWPTFKSQREQLKQIRSENEWVSSEYSEVLDDALRNVDNAFKAFFRRLKAGDNPGYPRFRKLRRYDTFVFSHGDRALKVYDRTIRIPNVGSVSFRCGKREIPNNFKTVRISRKGSKWYVSFEYVCEPRARDLTGKRVGIDVGIAKYAALSDGAFVENPRILEANRRKVVRLQRIVSRRRKFSRNWLKAVRLLAESKRREANRRRDFLHKESRRIANVYDSVAFEKLKVLNMSRSAKGTVEKPGKNVAHKSGLNRSMLDAAWSMFMNFCRYKVEETGGEVKSVDPKNTSRTCFACKHVSEFNRKSRSEFRCVSCGHEDHADTNAAKNVEFLAWSGPSRIAA
ncbi:MAG: RNA-guided endonuclease TnpB family protein [Isosphaeraceae bacterium]